jgi:asparagine synthase (glutamine-hydrolysing)
MCGISGVISTNRSRNNEIIRSMIDSLAHRGPDGEGIYSFENVSIGHRRLAIIDPDAGSQPLTNENNTIWLTFNGEIYNFLELKKILEHKGHVFRTHSDSEVIVHSYEEWGVDCVSKFRGMFAFAIVDTIKRTIFLARDHFGIKPLCYLSKPGYFAFSSEIKVLKKISPIPLDLKLESIDEYLWLGYIPAPKSIYKDVFKLPPAHRMTVSFSGEILDLSRYWEMEFRPDYTKTKQDWLAELDYVLEESVKAHLISDVPFGAFLSGGLDSSAVVTYMAKILKMPVKTFSIGFEESTFDETNYAKIVADKWKTDHHVEIVKPDALSILPDLVKHYGEPFGDSSAIPTYYVSKLARLHVPMVLSGDGGDELFAGYNSYLGWMQNFDSKAHNQLKHKTLQYLGHLASPKSFPLIKNKDSASQWLVFMRLVPPHIRYRLWRNDFHNLIQQKIELFEELYNKAAKLEKVQKAQYVDFNTYLPFDILTKVDIVSMANSLEVRTPFVDVNVVNFASTVPQHININRDFDEKWRGKLLIKQLLRQCYGNEFVNRTKMGFGVPLEAWFFNNKKVSSILHDKLLSPSSQLNEFFNPKMIRKLIERKSYTRLWLLLFLEEWLHQDKDQMHYNISRSRFR